MKLLSRTGANSSNMPPCYINPDDFNVGLVSQCTVSAFSMAIYLILFLLSLTSLRGDSGRYIASTKGISLLFLIGTLIISINVFSNEENTIVRELFRISSGVLIGIVLELTGRFGESCLSMRTLLTHPFCSIFLEHDISLRGSVAL